MFDVILLYTTCSCLPLLHLMIGAGMKMNLQLIHFLLVEEEEATREKRARDKDDLYEIV